MVIRKEEKCERGRKKNKKLFWCVWGCFAKKKRSNNSGAIWLWKTLYGTDKKIWARNKNDSRYATRVERGRTAQIEEKLKQDAGIGNEMREEWLKRLTTNTDRSFKLSETLINDFAIKKLDEFKTAVKEKLKNLS